MKRAFQIGVVIGLIFSNLGLGHTQALDQSSVLRSVGVVDSLYSEILGESRTVYVEMPYGFDPSKDKRYPVAYILDGELLLPTVHEVQNYYSGGFTPDMILVGIDNSEHRVRDLTPSVITSKYGMPFDEVNGGARQFREFFEDELIPYIDSKYPVSDYRLLIGHSYGGLFTVATLIEHPALFSSYLAIDPSLDWDDQIVLKEARSRLAEGDYRGKALFMSLSGQLHMQDARVTIDNVMEDTTDYTLFPRSNIALADAITQETSAGISFDWKFYPHDIHGTIPLPSIMDGMISLFSWYQMEDTDRINSFDTPKEELLSIIKHREQKLRAHFGYFEPPYPEELLNMSGYMNMDMQQFEKSKMYFELAIEYFPKSANAYDSMADYYESQNDITNAIRYVQMASKLSDSAYYRERIAELKGR